MHKSCTSKIGPLCPLCVVPRNPLLESVSVNYAASRPRRARNKSTGLPTSAKCKHTRTYTHTHTASGTFTHTHLSAHTTHETRRIHRSRSKLAVTEYTVTSLTYDAPLPRLCWRHRSRVVVRPRRSAWRRVEHLSTLTAADGDGDGCRRRDTIFNALCLPSPKSMNQKKIALRCARVASRRAARRA